MDNLQTLVKFQDTLERMLADLMDKSHPQFDFLVKQTKQKLDDVKNNIKLCKKETSLEAKRLNLLKKETQIQVGKVTFNKKETTITQCDSPVVFTSSVVTLSSSNRARFRQDTVDELQTVQKQLKHETETIYRLQNEKQPFSVQGLIDRARTKQNSLTDLIEQLENKIDDIDDGTLDEQFQKEVEHNQSEIDRKSQIKTAKKKKVSPRKPWVYQQFNRPEPSQKDVQFEYNKYVEATRRFPSNLAEKLKTLPNNRGFLWRGSSYYGQKSPMEPLDVCILSEKIDQGRDKYGRVQFKIHKHEYGSDYYKIYIEDRYGQHIIHQEKRKPRTTENGIIIK